MDLSRATGWARRLRTVEVRPIAVLAAVAVLTWSFAELTEDVLEEDTRGVDRALLLALREPGNPADPLGPRWMHEVGRDVTALGGIAVLSMLTAAVMGYLWLCGRGRLGWVLLAGMAGGGLWSDLLKDAFDRPRPNLVPYLSEAYSASFPSGHASLAASTYLVLGLMLAHVHRRRAVRAYIVGIAILLTVLVGISRVYVGVHWPTDVLAGWTLGALWAIVVWTVARWIEDRRARRAPAPCEPAPPATADP